MARQFNGTNQSLQSASTINLSASDKLTVAFWLWWDAFANDDHLALELSSNAGGVSGAFFIDPDDSGNDQFLPAVHGDVGFDSSFFTRPSSGAWHHYVFVFDMANGAGSEVEACYLDGALQSLTNGTTNNNTGNFGNFTLNVMARDNASLWAAGRMAELVLYGGTKFNQTNANALYNGGAGVDARTVLSPSFYWQLCGTASPEPALVGGINMTVNGATSVAHPISGAGICGGTAPTMLGVMMMS